MPEEARATFARLVLEDRERDIEALLVQIDAYLETIEDAAKTLPHINRDLATRIAESCRELLTMHDAASPTDRRHIVAAVEYFLLPRDGDDDLAYEGGLDDDAAVVTVVSSAVGRADLKVAP